MNTYKERFNAKAAAASKLTWFRSKTGDYLHFLPEADDEGKWWEDATEEGAKIGRSACGLYTLFWAPGLFSRMGAPRCAHCCKKVGIPLGPGTPFNDNSLRF